MRVLVLGDVVGQTGCRCVFAAVPSLRRRIRADVVIANGENAAEGFGLTPVLFRSLRRAGVDVVTSGNHIWQKREIYPLLESEDRLLRPENYPIGVPGKGWCSVSVRGTVVSIVNLEGRKALSSIRCPFHVAGEMVRRLHSHSRIIVVDFHAEAGDEKEALAFHLDGRVAAVVGTHTHVQTADEKILPGGTGYLTDAGMCGPPGSVIGMKREVAVRRHLTQMPLKMEVDDAPAVLSGVLLEIDESSGRTVELTRIMQEGVV